MNCAHFQAQIEPNGGLQCWLNRTDCRQCCCWRVICSSPAQTWRWMSFVHSIWWLLTAVLVAWGAKQQQQPSVSNVVSRKMRLSCFLSPLFAQKIWTRPVAKVSNINLLSSCSHLISAPTDAKIRLQIFILPLLLENTVVVNHQKCLLFNFHFLCFLRFFQYLNVDFWPRSLQCCKMRLWKWFSNTVK